MTRCAIYTRKSSEEGLEQSFNSLDAQREACEAFILSQKHAGWATLPAMYDDGGISGGTLERPALQRLLADITARRVDTVVVYKVDRLTRSLADFAKIVDIFDASGVAFVSVTQQFNTTSSMGRLTLNMLLSFAQFEREVTGERIRDKIALSKQKGMWMGGPPPLGFDAVDRKLVVNAAEAETVRHVFRRYLALGSVRALKEELDRAGLVSKARSGGTVGGRPLARGALYHLLQNRLYRGEVVHKGVAYPGQHDAIIDEALWDKVQSGLANRRVARAERSAGTDIGAVGAGPSLLAGLVFDGGGERMSPTHANKNGVRYRYYVSRSLLARSRSAAPTTARRVPAADLEDIVAGQITALLQDQTALYQLTAASADAVTPGLQERLAIANDFGRRWPSLRHAERSTFLRAALARVTVHPAKVDIELRVAPLLQTGAAKLDADLVQPQEVTTVLSVAAQPKRMGVATKLLIDAALSRREPDPTLLRVLADALQVRTAVMEGEGRGMSALADQLGINRSHFARLLRLSFLSPAIVHAILGGRQPVELNATKLIRNSTLPLAWADQHRHFDLR